MEWNEAVGIESCRADVTYQRNGWYWEARRRSLDCGCNRCMLFFSWSSGWTELDYSYYNSVHSYFGKIWSANPSLFYFAHFDLPSGIVRTSIGSCSI